MNVLAKLLQFKNWVGAAIWRHPGRFFVGALVILVLTVGALFIKGKDTADTVEAGIKKDRKKTVLTNRENKALKQENAKLNDSIATTTDNNKKIKHGRDSLAVVVKKKAAIADSALKILTHESTTDSDSDPRFISRFLAEDYKPQAYTLPNGDTLR